MAFSPFSQPVRPAQFQDPLDLTAYSQGLLYKEGIAKDNLQLIGSTLNSFSNIPAYGIDAEILQNKMADIKSQVASMDVSNLGNVNTLSQISSIVSQASNDPDILAIAQRANKYNEELKLKKDAEAKGHTYSSSILDDANEYYNSGTFIRDKRFTGYGFIDPDNKDLDEVAKNTPEFENWITKGGYDYHTKGKAENTLYQNYMNLFQNNPKWQQKFSYDFDKKFKNLNIDDLMNSSNEAIAYLLPNLPLQEQQAAVEYLQQAQSMSDNPYIQSAIKDKLKSDYIKNQAYMAAQAKTYANTVDKRANDFAKSARDLQEAKELAKYNYDLKNQEDINKLSPLQQAYVRKLITSGIPKEQIFDSEGNIDFATLPDIPEKAAAQKESQKDAGTRAVNNLISRMRSGTITTTDEETYKNLIKNRKLDLGYPAGTTIKDIKFDEGVITFTADAPGVGGKQDGKQTITLDELENKLKGVQNNTVLAPGSLD